MSEAATDTPNARQIALLGMLAMVLIAGCGPTAREQRNQAQAQVDRIADDLDRRTTETGVYLRVEDDEIKETDPWGTRINVSYAQGGVAETVQVRSAGPDRQFNTGDDVAAERMSANFKGVGEGIKKNAEETASNVAKGMVKGTVSGVKESIKQAFPRKKKAQDTADETPTQKTEPEKPE